MNETEKEQNGETKSDRKRSRRGLKQGPLSLHETLGLAVEDTKDLEQKLYIARFFDYFSEDTFEFAYKERYINEYKENIKYFLEKPEEEGTEEDKLLKKSLESKDVLGIIDNLKNRTEEIALENGFKKEVGKRVKILTLVTALPLFVFIIIIMFVFIDLFPIWYIFPILCVGCMAPQLIRGNILRKWYNFKEAQKNSFFTENRDDIMILKGCTQEFLDNMRIRLLDLEVPIQLIKFVLYSRDYENLDLINEKMFRGSRQYFFSFAYPEGMEPFPLPEKLLQQQPELMKGDKPEKNFIVLTELKAKNGVLSNFLPALKTDLSDQINAMLNECEFASSTKTFKQIIPDYAEEKPLDEEEEILTIYCVCGQISKITDVQICTHKSGLKFYLLDAEKCECEEKIYALSLMDESDVDKIPEDLRNIFLS